MPNYTNVKSRPKICFQTNDFGGQKSVDESEMSGMQSSFVDVTIANDEGFIVHMKSPAQQLLSKNNSFVLDSESSDEKQGD